LCIASFDRAGLRFRMCKEEQDVRERGINRSCWGFMEQ